MDRRSFLDLCASYPAKSVPFMSREATLLAGLLMFLVTL